MWLVDLVGQPPPVSETFETACKATPARVTVRLRDGAEHTAELAIPVGAIGPDTRGGHAALVREKYLSTGGGENVADLAAGLREASAADVRLMLEEALSVAYQAPASRLFQPCKPSTFRGVNPCPSSTRV